MASVAEVTRFASADPGRLPGGAPTAAGERLLGAVPSPGARLALAQLARDLPGATRAAPTDTQLAALEYVVAQPRGEIRARVLLALREAGLPLGLGSRPDSKANLDAALALGEAAWRGALPGVGGDDPMARLIALARAAARAATVGVGGARRLDRAALRRLRAGTGLGASVREDLLVRTGPLPDPSGGSRALPPELTAPGGGTRAPARRITRELASATQAAGRDVLPPDLMVSEPGQPAEPFTHQGAAERLDRWTRGLGTRHEDRILTLLYGLAVADRIEVAVSFARLRAARGERPWQALVATLDAAGAEPEAGRRRDEVAAACRRAYDAFAAEMVAELDDSPFGHTAEGILVRAELDPGNPTGEPLAADVLEVDVSGWFARNGEAVLRLLERSSPAALVAIDQDLRARHGTTLARAVERLPAAARRKAQFLLRAERASGRVPAVVTAAFDVREAALRDDWASVFRRLEGETEAGVREIAAAFARTFSGAQGESGAGGDLGASALYRFLVGRARTGDVQRRLELELAWYPPAREGEPAPQVRVAGGRYVPCPDAPAELEAAREALFREKTALYVALSAGETAVVVGQLRSAREPPDGRPTVAEVESAYRRLGTRDLEAGDGRLLYDPRFDAGDPAVAFLTDVEKVGGRASAQLSALLRGDALGRGARIALSVQQAIERGRLEDAYATAGVTPVGVGVALAGGEPAGAVLAAARAEIERSVASTRGHVLARVLMDLLGTEGRALDSLARTFGAAVREYGVLLASGAPVGALTEAETRIQAAFAELVARTGQYERLRGERAELVRNVAWTVGVTAVLTLAPATSPALLAAVGGVVGGGVGWALDEPASAIVRGTARGLVTGALAGLGAAGLRHLDPAAGVLAKGGQAAITGTGIGIVRRGADAATDPSTWAGGTQRGGLRRGAERVLRSAFDPLAMGVDFATTYAASVAVGVARERLARHKGGAAPHDTSGGGGQTNDGGGTGGAGAGGTGSSGAAPPGDATSPAGGGGLPSGSGPPAPPTDAVHPASGGGLPSGVVTRPGPT